MSNENIEDAMEWAKGGQFKDVLRREIIKLRAERDEAIKKYHDEIHRGRIACEKLVKLNESAVWGEAALYAAPHVGEKKDRAYAVKLGLVDIFKARGKTARES